METIVLRTRKGRVLSRVTLSLILTMSFATVLYYGFGPSWAVGLVVCVVLILSRPIMLLFRDDALVISLDTLRDRTSGLGEIPMAMIERTRVRRVGGLDRLELDLRDPKEWLSEMTFARRLFSEYIVLRGLGPGVMLGYIDADPIEVKQLVDSRSGGGA